MQEALTKQALIKQSGTWKWGLLCLAFLAPFFFLSYGFANQYASSLTDVATIVFAWEQTIPLWPWTIVPYWSIDLFYGLSLLLCWNKFELRQHVFRLLSAQIISISCFLLFPLKFSFERPELSGFFGIWFDVLMGFDKPFNQAPSLHIVLLIILWDFYRHHVSSQWKWVVDFWSVLIGLSVLTTWQHHFIDLPTGLLVGALCLWFFPISSLSPFKKDQQQRLTPQHLKLAAYYVLTSLMLGLIAYVFKGIFLWLIYPACSLFLVSLAYLFIRPHFFQKDRNGHMSYASLILFAPYLIFAWINSRIWTRQHPQNSKVIQINHAQFYLGRIPNQSVLQNTDAIFDCCAELPCSFSDFTQHTHLSPPRPLKLRQAYLSLDLIALQANQLQLAVAHLDQLIFNVDATNTHNPLNQPKIEPYAILIFCALGYSRSSAILCAWLLKNGHVDSIPEGITLIQTARPWIVLKDEQIKQLQLYHFKLKGLAP